MRRASSGLLLFCLALAVNPSMLQAQCPSNYARVIAVKIGAAVQLASGVLDVTAHDASGQQVNYNVPGQGVGLLKPYRSGISKGALTQLLCVPLSDKTSPPIGYHFVIRDTSPSGGNATVLDVDNIAITSDPFVLDSYSFPSAIPYTLQPVINAPLGASGDRALVSAGQGAATWLDLPQCNDALHALSYDRTTHSYSCSAIHPAGSPVTAVGSAGQVQISDGNGSVTPSDNTTVLNGLDIQDYRTVSAPWLASYQNALDNCQNQPVYIDVKYDSRGIVDNQIARTSRNGSPLSLDIPFEERWSQLWLKDLREQCPSLGSGMKPVIWGIYGSSSSIVSANPNFWIMGAFDVSNELGPSFGAARSVVALRPGNSATFQIPEAYDTLRIACAADSSSAALTVSVDGVVQPPACGGSAAFPTPSLYASNLLPLRKHVATFYVPNWGQRLQVVCGRGSQWQGRHSDQ